MAKDKASVMVYYDYKDQFELLNDAQLRSLIYAMIDYDLKGEYEELDTLTTMAFMPIKKRIDRDKEKYYGKCEKNKNNIQSYWDKVKSEKDTNVYERIRTNTMATDKDKEKEKEKDKDKGKGKDIYMSPTLTQIISFSKELGYGDESYCKRFFNHYESVGWKTTNGALIENWKPKFEEWLEKDKVVKNGGDETREVIRPGSPGKRRIL